MRTCALKSASISEIVPETCVPTLMVFCGLSVPLAVTVCDSEPVCTGTVVYVTAAARERTAMTETTIAAITATAATTNHQRGRRRAVSNLTVETRPLVAGRSKVCMAVPATARRS